MISVIIPTFKNKNQLISNLKINLPFLKGCEIIIVNDDPSESIKNDLKLFSEIKLIENSKNFGFGQTVNRGVHEATGNYLFLLNTDVILKDDSYKKALEHFKKSEDLFAVSFAQIEKDGSVVGKNSIYWKNGFFYHKKADNLEPGINGWAEGGSCIIDKTKFDELKGFDNLYSPFYWEDIDLSFNAWKAGYKVIFDPNIVVEHHHGATTNKYISSDYKETITARNHYLFIWKNITDKPLLIQHVLLLPFHLLYFSFKNTYLVKGFFAALPFLLKLRSNSKPKVKYSDRYIIELFSRKSS